MCIYLFILVLNWVMINILVEKLVYLTGEYVGKKKRNINVIMLAMF